MHTSGEPSLKLLGNGKGFHLTTQMVIYYLYPLIWFILAVSNWPRLVTLRPKQLEMNWKFVKEVHAHFDILLCNLNRYDKIGEVQKKPELQ
jgi:hypothetical protein